MLNIHVCVNRPLKVRSVGFEICCLDVSQSDTNNKCVNQHRERMTVEDNKQEGDLN